MKSTLLIHTHLGLGDHFVCNGLIRHIVKKNEFDKYLIPSKQQNFPTVKRMYDDLKNVEVFSVVDDIDVYTDLNTDRLTILRVGFENLKHNVNFDKSFYDQLNIPLEYKRSEFKVHRDIDKETKCVNHYNPPDDYIFVHDKSSVGKYDLKINSNLPRVTPEGYDFTLIDYLTLIDNAQEVHCVDSSFLNMIDLCGNCDRMFFHRVKKSQYPSISKSWKVVEYENN